MTELQQRSQTTVGVTGSWMLPDNLLENLQLIADGIVAVAGFDVPHDWPADATFDLVVVSEVGYFMSPAELETLINRIVGSLDPAGVVVLCHWRHRVEGWVLDADEVHTRFEDSRLPELSATYRNRDVEIRVHAHDDGWPDPLR